MGEEIIFNTNEGEGEPVGYRFHPTDEEIIDHYLKLKINGHHSLVDNVIGEVDHLYQLEPWDLRDRSRRWSNDHVWYFFCRPDYKYTNSKRANRATLTGFWKATGKIRRVKARGREIGTKRTLVFYNNGYPNSKAVRTSWVIHEYQAKTVLPDQTTYLVCKLKNKSDEQTESSPSHRLAAGADNNAAQATIPELPVEPALELPGYFNDGISVVDLLQPNYSDNDRIGRIQSDTSEEGVDATEFVNSILVTPDEYYSEETAHTPPSAYHAPRFLSQVYIQESADADTEIFQAGLQAEPALELQADFNDGISLVDLLQPNYSDNDPIGRIQSDTSKEGVDAIEFVNSILVPSDEYYSEETAHTPPRAYCAPQSLSQVYIQESSDTDTEIFQAEYFTTMGPSKLYHGQTSSKAYRQMVGASSVDVAATGPKSINCIQQVAAEFQSAYKPQHQPRATDLKADKGVTSRGIQLLSKTTRISKDKATDTTRRGTVADLPEKKRFSMQSESDRKMVQVTNAKPNLKMRSNDSLSSDWNGSIICQETPLSSYRTSPPSVYLLNVVVGLGLFILFVIEILIFHH